MRRAAIPSLLFVAAAAATVWAEEAPVQPGSQVSFRRHVAPIFLEKCLACHNTRTNKGDYDLSSYERMMDAVREGRPERSSLYRLIVDENPKRRMPKEKDPLSAADIGLIEKWIADGAEYDGDDPKEPLRTIVPRTKQPAAPEIYRVPIPVTALVFSPDGDRVVAGGYHELTVWNANDGSLAR